MIGKTNKGGTQRCPISPLHQNVYSNKLNIKNCNCIKKFAFSQKNYNSPWSSYLTVQCPFSRVHRPTSRYDFHVFRSHHNSTLKLYTNRNIKITLFYIIISCIFFYLGILYLLQYNTRNFYFYFYGLKWLEVLMSPQLYVYIIE